MFIVIPWVRTPKSLDIQDEISRRPHHALKRDTHPTIPRRWTPPITGRDDRRARLAPSADRLGNDPEGSGRRPTTVDDKTLQFISQRNDPPEIGFSAAGDQTRTDRSRSTRAPLRSGTAAAATATAANREGGREGGKGKTAPRKERSVWSILCQGTGKCGL